MKNTIKIFASLLVIALVALSCNKEKGQGSMTLRMKDAPIDFDSVIVEIVQVDVHTEQSGWVTLNSNAGLYNLLELQNDVTAVLVNQNELPAGELSQLRLILGSNNYATADSINYPLLLNSQSNTGIKINLNANVPNNQLVEVLIDFDAEQSIVEQGNGSFRLKPVIKVESITYI